MKPSSKQEKSRARRMDRHSPIESRKEEQAGASEALEPIPPYLLNPEGLEAPLPPVTELPPEKPRQQKAPPAAGATFKPPELARREPSHRGFDPHGFKGRNTSVTRLHEHQVHSRGR